MKEEGASSYRINLCNLTKVWPHKDYPLIEVGVIELNRTCCCLGFIQILETVVWQIRLKALASPRRLKESVYETPR
jgi:hypothetical protein